MSHNHSSYTYEVLYYEGTGLGEITRVIVSAAGFKLVQKYIDDDTIVPLKPSLLFNQVPRLTVFDTDGKVVLELVQSRAMSKYVARVAGFLGTTAEEAAVIEQYAEAAREAADSVSKHWWSETGRKVEIPKLIEAGGPVHRWVTKFEELLSKSSTGFLVGNSLTFADIYLFQTIEEFKILYPAFIATFKHVQAHFEKVGSTPSLKAYTSDPKRVKSFYSQPDVY